ncbi:MAG: NAD(P)/FAD-dependent oxidoreductase, partial [Cytophagaceae bacterium]
QLARLSKHNITILEKEIAELVHDNGQLKNILFKDGVKMDFNAAYAAVPFNQHSDIPFSLGCELTEHGYIKTNDFQQTTVDGVYACGDNTNMMRSVANAVYSGNLAGAIVNKELTDERF